MPESDPLRQRVLVVDDEADIRGLIGSVLDATALDHDDAGDGNEALDRLSAEEYGAVILDIMMPGTDGLAVLGTLHTARPELLSRIIVLTGGTDELVARIDQPVFRVMRKPFSPRVLVETVSACLRQAPAAPEPPQRVDGPQLSLAQQGGFIVDFPGLERWWVEGDVEPFRSQARGLSDAAGQGSGGKRAPSSSGILLTRTTESIRDMLLDLEKLGMAVRV